MNRFGLAALAFAVLLLAACAATVPAATEPVTPQATDHATQPADTLQPDAFDAPAASSVAEAQKAAGGGHAAHQHAPASTPAPAPAHTHDDTPTPQQKATPKQTRTKPSSTKQQVTYVCPMHPEVTSGKPGKCPKCGMSLVIRKEQP